MSQQHKSRPGGPRGRRGRAVVRLDAAALWERLAELDRSQNWLARETGVSHAYLSMLVNGRRSPSVSVRRRMQKVIGLSFYDLFVKDTVRVESGSMKRSVSGDFDEA